MLLIGFKATIIYRNKVIIICLKTIIDIFVKKRSEAKTMMQKKIFKPILSSAFDKTYQSICNKNVAAGSSVLEISKKNMIESY